MRQKRGRRFFIGICLFYVLGVVLGARGAAKESFELPSLYVSAAPFLPVFLKYSVYVLLFWLCGIYPPGLCGIFALLLWKGAGYGLLSAALFAKEGIRAFLAAFTLYVPQGFIVNAAYLFAAFFASENILKRYELPAASRRAARPDERYILALVFCLLLTAGAAAVECFLLPVFHSV
ncbi:MAG: stage II sporulation protein M [Firmicutes bacterium]|nr:stage II sporulation protein M [Bacillota bacterium]